MRRKFGSLIFALSMLGGSLAGVFTPRNAEAACCGPVVIQFCRDRCFSQGCTALWYCDGNFCVCPCEC
jgi:hypothetical protein